MASGASLSGCPSPFGARVPFGLVVGNVMYVCLRGRQVHAGTAATRCDFPASGSTFLALVVFAECCCFLDCRTLVSLEEYCEPRALLNFYSAPARRLRNVRTSSQGMKVENVAVQVTSWSSTGSSAVVDAPAEARDRAEATSPSSSRGASTTSTQTPVSERVCFPARLQRGKTFSQRDLEWSGQY